MWPLKVTGITVNQGVKWQQARCQNLKEAA